MKNRKTFIMLSTMLLSLAGATSSFAAEAQAPATAPQAPVISTDVFKNLKIAVVNFKACVDKSKAGKQEQASFDALRKQMESVLEEKEKTLNELSNKLNDLDYLDSLSAEAETELKRKFRALSQEAAQIQNQYYQTLNQANVKVIQNLQEMVSKATKTVAENNQLDIVLNEEGSFFYSPKLDISDSVIKVMDQMFDNEQKETKPGEKKN